MGRKLRALTSTIRKRTAEAKREVLALTEQTGRLLETSITEARKLAATALRRARGRGAQAKLKAARRLEELADHLRKKVCSQIRQRVAGEPITDRLISLWDPDARPNPQGQARQANPVPIARLCRGAADGGGERLDLPEFRVVTPAGVSA